MSKSSEYMSWEEAVEQIMSATGKTRRQATAFLLEKCRQGSVRATGVRSDTGDRVVVPPKAFPCC